jgi:hypothetical protein
MFAEVDRVRKTETKLQVGGENAGKEDILNFAIPETIQSETC